MSIVTRAATAEYRSGWEETFGKKTENRPTAEICGMTYCSDGNASGHSGVEFSACGRPKDHEGPRGDIRGTRCGRGPT
jgi:hypothetical protein